MSSNYSAGERCAVPMGQGCSPVRHSDGEEDS